MQFKDLGSQLSSFFDSEKGKTVSKWFQRVLFVIIIIWMGYELTKVGWSRVWESLPVQPLFYLLFLFAYFQLPFFEVWIYRLTWKFNALKSIPTFITKRVYNKDVLGYSGEIYFFSWAKKNLSLTDKEIALTIKDNNIISSVASTFVSVGLLSVFFFTGQVPIDTWFSADQLVYWIIGIVLAVVLGLVIYRFRNYVIHMKWSTAASIFGIQMLRLIFVQALNLMMFYVVMPQTELYVWFTYLSLEIILSRIPFLPNKDFIFVSLSITMAGNLSVSESEIAGLMLTRSVLGKILNFIFFAMFNFIRPKGLDEITNEQVSKVI